MYMDIQYIYTYMYVCEGDIHLDVSFKKKTDEKVDGGKTDQMSMYDRSPPEWGFVNEFKDCTRTPWKHTAKLEHTK